jgi:hypothetical protein
MKTTLTLLTLTAALTMGSLLPALADDDSYHRAVHNAQQAAEPIRQRNQAETDAHNARIDHPTPPPPSHTPGVGETRNVPPQAVSNVKSRGTGPSAERAE